MKIFKTKKEMLDEALYSTYCKYEELEGKKTQFAGLDHAYSGLYSFARNGDSNFISNICDGRDDVEANWKKTDLAELLAKEYIKKARSKLVSISAALKIFSLPETEAVKQISDCILKKQEDFGGLTATEMSQEVCRSYVEDIIEEYKEKDQKIAKAVEKKLHAEKPQMGIKNVFVNRSLTNYCREEILSGRQIQIQNELMKKPGMARPARYYNLNDELIAATDIGMHRHEQQDSVLLLYHPSNPDYKLLVVADGVGSSEDGAKASQEVVKKMLDWFEHLNPEVFKEENIDILQSAWTAELEDINQAVIDMNGGKVGGRASSSTFVGAIVGEESTMIASVGDSRCYAYGTNGELYRITVDDNLEYQFFDSKWKEYVQKVGRPLNEQELIEWEEERNDLRFSRGSNVISRAVGLDTEIEPHFGVISNSRYNALLLFSDGVTDCLSDKDILAVTRTTDRKNLAKKLVEKALTTESKREKQTDRQHHRDYIIAGKDNTTAAVYHNYNAGDKGDER